MRFRNSLRSSLSAAERKSVGLALYAESVKCQIVLKRCWRTWLFNDFIEGTVLSFVAEFSLLQATTAPRVITETAMAAMMIEFFVFILFFLKLVNNVVVPTFFMVL